MGFKMMDKDGSGCVELNEYMELVGGMMEGFDSAMGEMPAMPAMDGMPAMPAMEMPAMDMESVM